MEPLRIEDEESWFLKYVTNVFDGHLPGAFWGPTSLFALRQRVDGIKATQMED